MDCFACALELGVAGVAEPSDLRLATDGFPSEMSSVKLRFVDFLRVERGGGEGEGGTSGGGSDLLKPLGVFPCRALWARYRSNRGVNHT